MRIKLTEEQYALINEYVNNGGNIQEEDTSFTVPPIVLSKKTGMEGTASRGEIEKFINALGGGSMDQFFKNLKMETDNPQTPQKMVSTLIILDLLKKINEDFDRSAGGFMFEYLISPIMGAVGVPTKTKIEDKIMSSDKSTNKKFKEGLILAMKKLTRQHDEDISDVTKDNVGYSVKNLSSETKPHGSLVNLIGSMYVYDDIKFLVARRVKNDDIRIYEFSVGDIKNPNTTSLAHMNIDLISIINKLKDIDKESNDKIGKGNDKREKTPEDVRDEIMSLSVKKKPASGRKVASDVIKTGDTEQFISYDDIKTLDGDIITNINIKDAIRLSGATQSDFEDVFKNRVDSETLGILVSKYLDEVPSGAVNEEETDDEKKSDDVKLKGQFEFKDSVLGQMNTITTIPMSQISVIEKNIVDNLNTTIKNISNDLKSLSSNLNSFYTESDPKNKNAFGKEAKDDADNISCEVNAEISAEGAACTRK